jgi:hypothetical protein
VSLDITRKYGRGVHATLHLKKELTHLLQIKDPGELVESELLLHFWLYVKRSLSKNRQSQPKA